MKVIGQHRARLSQAIKSEVETVKAVKTKPELSEMEKRIAARNAAVGKVEDTAEAEAKAEAEKVAAEKAKAEKAEAERAAAENAKDNTEGGDDSQKNNALSESIDGLGDGLARTNEGLDNLENRVDDVEYDIEKIKEKLGDENEYIGNPELETHKAILAASIDEMLNVEDIEDRKAYKAEAIVKLIDFVNGYVSSAAKYPNIVAVWVMIWLFDLGDIARALPLALHLAKQKIHNMPTRFKSEIETFICDQMYDWAKAKLDANKSAGPYLDDLIKTIESEKWKLSDIVHGKMYAMHGKHLEVLGEDEAALSAFEKAMSLNSAAGVKKKIERLRAKLKV